MNVALTYPIGNIFIVQFVDLVILLDVGLINKENCERVFDLFAQLTIGIGEPIKRE